MTDAQTAALRDLAHFRVLGQLEHERLLVQGASGAYVLSRSGLLSPFRGRPTSPRPHGGHLTEGTEPCAAP